MEAVATRVGQTFGTAHTDIHEPGTCMNMRRLIGLREPAACGARDTFDPAWPPRWLT